MRIRALVHLLLASPALVLGLVAGTRDARAQANYCVGTPQELVAAVDDFNAEHASSNHSLDLRIRSGTYLLPAPANRPFALQLRPFFLGANYRISGGWDAACQAQASTPNLGTVLSGQGARGVLEVVAMELGPAMVPPSPRASVRIDNLRFTAGIAELAGFALAGCLRFTSAVNLTTREPAEFSLVIERAVFSACREALATGPAHSAVIRNSLFIDNFGRTPSINAFAARGTMHITNNTFRRNQVITTNVVAGDILAGSDGDHPGLQYITNNVFAETDLSSSPVAAQVAGGLSTWVRRNRITAVLEIPGFDPPVQFGNTTLEATFASQFDSRLVSSSLLRDFGDSSAPGGVGTHDLVGAPRVQGLAVDLGAYELGPAPVLPDALFANGFD